MSSTITLPLTLDSHSLMTAALMAALIATYETSSGRLVAEITGAIANFFGDELELTEARIASDY